MSKVVGIKFKYIKFSKTWAKSLILFWSLKPSNPFEDGFSSTEEAFDDEDSNTEFYYDAATWEKELKHSGRCSKYLSKNYIHDKMFGVGGLFMK